MPSSRYERLPLRALLVEDSRGDARLLEAQLSETEMLQDEPERADSVAAALDRLRNGAPRPDVVLLDLDLPDASRLGAVEAVVEAAPGLPVVVLTRRSDREMALAALRRGAEDYLVKGELEPGLLGRAVRYGVERKRAERERLENKLRHRALHDRLTGLPNRTLFWDRLEHALERSRRAGETVAVLFLNLDGFGRINDEYGHAAGDEVLRRVAGRLRSTVRDADTLARLGGDEFGVLLEHVERRSEAEKAADRLVDRFDPAVPVAGEEALLRVSCGIALAGDGAGAEPVVADDLMRRVDRAMYGAKEEPGSAYRTYGPEIADGDRPGRLRREIELQEALEGGDVAPYFQPIVDLEDGRIVGAEALARWIHPERGTITPGEFIALAEETGLIVGLGREIARSALARLSSWEDEGSLPPDFRLHLNLSATEVGRPDAVEFLAGLQRECGLEEGDAAIEVTETVAVESTGRVTAIRELGFPVAVDDFGTQYATLERLVSLELDTLKLDRLFVNQIGESDRHEAVLEASLTLAASMGVRPVAEGVETEAQRGWLLDHGCRYAQGFLFGRAVPAGEFAGWLRSGGTLPA